jgi:hypothetical protein
MRQQYPVRSLRQPPVAAPPQWGQGHKPCIGACCTGFPACFASLCGELGAGSPPSFTPRRFAAARAVRSDISRRESSGLTEASGAVRSYVVQANIPGCHLPMLLPPYARRHGRCRSAGCDRHRSHDLQGGVDQRRRVGAGGSVSVRGRRNARVAGSADGAGDS